jgi:hypothetical protein
MRAWVLLSVLVLLSCQVSAQSCTVEQQIQMCNVTDGTGLQTCTNGTWSTCSATSCEQGYELELVSGTTYVYQVCI